MGRRGWLWFEEEVRSGGSIGQHRFPTDGFGVGDANVAEFHCPFLQRMAKVVCIVRNFAVRKGNLF